MKYTKGKDYVIDSQQRAVIRVSESKVAIYLSAPEMYEALKAWMTYAESNYSGDGMGAVALSKKVLAKAEGK